MQIDYIFIVPLTPPDMLDDRRLGLRNQCFQQLSKLDVSKEVFLLGECPDGVENFRSFATKGKTKEDKLFEIGHYLDHNDVNARYLVRLDDDDLINPELFSHAINGSFDCMADDMHWFYDLSSGLCSRQKRPWLANTVIHRFECAMQKIPAIGGSANAGKENYLFACDHSKAWFPFYKERNLKYTSADTPLYLRILNPGSRTATAGNDNPYNEYLASFGHWKESFPLDVSLHGALKELWEITEGDLKEYDFSKKSIIQRVLQRIKR